MILACLIVLLVLGASMLFEVFVSAFYYYERSLRNLLVAIIGSACITLDRLVTEVWPGPQTKEKQT